MNDSTQGQKNNRTPAQIAIDQKFIRAGHKLENLDCNHKHYNFKEHGRCCTCGTCMVDFGD